MNLQYPRIRLSLLSRLSRLKPQCWRICWAQLLFWIMLAALGALSMGSALLG